VRSKHECKLSGFAKSIPQKLKSDRRHHPNYPHTAPFQGLSVEIQVINSDDIPNPENLLRTAFGSEYLLFPWTICWSFPGNFSRRWGGHGLVICIFPGSLVSVRSYYAGNKMDFTRGKFKPKSASSILQAIICRFFGCNFVFLVNSWSPGQNSTQESRVSHLSGAGVSVTLLHEVLRSWITMHYVTINKIDAK